MTPETPTRVLVVGLESAARVHAAMDRQAAAMVPDPRWQGGQCWSLYADIPTPVSTELVAAVQTAVAALLISPDGAGGWHCHLHDRHERVELPVPAGGTRSRAADQALRDWCARHRSDKKPPPFLRQATRARPWVPDLLEDDTARLLRDFGWPLHQGFPDRALLPGAQELVEVAVQAGETRIPNSVTTYCGGFTKDHWALWDRRRPTAPIRVWPIEDQRGLDEVKSSLRQLVVDPIIDSTTQRGARTWATADPKYDGASPVSGLLVHWNPDGRMSVIVPTERPATVMISRPGHATLHGILADAMLQTTGLGSIDVPLKDFDTVLAVARAQFCMYEVGPWRDVPPDAGPGLRPTCAAIRRSRLEH